MRFGHAFLPRCPPGERSDVGSGCRGALRAAAEELNPASRAQFLRFGEPIALTSEADLGAHRRTPVGVLISEDAQYQGGVFAVQLSSPHTGRSSSDQAAADQALFERLTKTDYDGDTQATIVDTWRTIARVVFLCSELRDLLHSSREMPDRFPDQADAMSRSLDALKQQNVRISSIRPVICLDPSSVFTRVFLFDPPSKWVELHE